MNRFIALILIILLSPIYLFCILFLLIQGGPVFYISTRYKQYRIGFTFYKFCTIQDGKPTAFGKFLRKTSLDELPNLFNVFLGDCNFIGPRPILYNEIPKYDWQRFSVKAGLVCLPQVFGRKNLSQDKINRLERYYVTHISVRLKLKILVLTAVAIIKEDGAY